MLVYKTARVSMTASMAAFPIFILPTATPCSPWRSNRDVTRLVSPLEDFIFCEPGTDNIDMLAGPFLLRCDICMNDYIEIGQMGASGKAMRRDSHRFISPPSV